MSKRENVYVSNDEMQEQRKIIDTIKNNNEIEYQMTGKVKKMFVVTYGCQQNENDSEKLRGMLCDMGYESTEIKEEADIIIYNTCCVRENAELKVYGNIGALKAIKRENPDLIIGICGCMMQQQHVVDTIKSKYKHVDLVFGTHNIHRFPEILQKSLNEKHTLFDVINSEGIIYEDLPSKRESKSRAWVSIMYGCNNFCSYCIVPYVRGRERSRLPENIIKEITELSNDGCKEITLLGQNVNSYGNNLDIEIDFSDLLEMVSQIKGIERIRFMTSHPKDISEKLIMTMSKHENICKHLHLPFQAGSNNILKLMNRKYTREEYLEKINMARRIIPNLTFTTDIIVGFPNETTEDFEQTLDIVKEVKFDQIFMFIYSKRKGTPAEKYEDKVDIKEKKKNFQRLVDVQNEISKNINLSYVGKVEKVLVEGTSKNDSDTLSGRTESSKVVNFKGDSSLIDTFVNVKITEAHSWFLNGEIV